MSAVSGLWAPAGLRAARAISREEFDGVYRRHSGLVYARARSILGVEADARDAVHDVFVRMAERWHRFDPERPLQPWLMRMTTNHCIDRLRRRRPTDDLDDAPLPDERQLSRLEHRSVLRRLLGRLDSKTQAVVVAHYVDGLTQAEIAESLDCSEKTVARRLGKFRAYVARMQKKGALPS